MYPDWPESDADLVPLPNCDGPKLKSFDFQGPQKIEFLEYLGEGLHAHVFKVKILGQVYALKLFRFAYDHNWVGPASDTDPGNRELMSAFYNYSEPFSSECRAFGRLQETGYEELAVRCFGYVLLDEEHEHTIMTQFSDLKLEFNGDIDYPGAEDMRSRFPGKDARAPPIRGVVKEFGLQDEENLGTTVVRKILRDVIKLQQLGIIRIDVGTRQIIDDKLCDFSTAVTIPHFRTNPELNPHLTPEMICAIELETFELSINDYLEFDEMIFDWNLEYADEKGRISVYAFPDGRGGRHKYNLRSRATKECAYTFVDPRKYDWRTYPTSVGASRKEVTRRRWSGRISKSGGHENPQGVSSRIRRHLRARPPVWYYEYDSKLAKCSEWATPFSDWMDWDYKDGLMFPRIKKRFYITHQVSFARTRLGRPL
ncbi:kinetochore Sim4 complex subunit FTA2-domain-containing protein [Xylaria digitata]|nr:kinetochore Sim4 complex subunit FTA2-domain-containing protein [Xylaria digitata]